LSRIIEAHFKVQFDDHTKIVNISYDGYSIQRNRSPPGPRFREHINWSNIDFRSKFAHLTTSMSKRKGATGYRYTVSVRVPSSKKME